MLPFKPKSIEALRAGHVDPVELTVYEGAIRSSKTWTSLWDWDNYILHCPEKTFLMSGNTLGSLSRNCIDGEFGFLAVTGGLAQQRTDRDGSHFLSYGDKKIYLMGANDAASYRKLRGLSIGGWYADEINLHDKAFVETALGRSFASRWIRNIWTLNPSVPSHWLYTDKGIGIDRYGAPYVKDLYRWLHYTLDDNPAMTEERKARIAMQYSGVFFKRDILGMRVRGEGGCYPSFVHNRKGEPGNVLDEVPAKIYRATFGLDFGGNKSATTFCCTGWFVKDRLPAIVILDEVYDLENKSVESVMRAWSAFVDKCRRRWPIDVAWGDSAEQLILKSLNQLPTGLHVGNAMKRAINDRIRLFDVLFSQGRAYIMRNCKKTIEAFENAVYDEKSLDESRLDDGSTNIDSLDAAEYSVERDMSQLIEGVRV